VGRVIPNKRFEDVIRSFAVYQRWRNPRSRLLLVGDTRGFERSLHRLRELVRELRVEEVVFTGQVDDDDLYAYYRVADVFLCLSEHEGFCVPLQEAMHFHLPVIAYDTGAVRETLRGGGLLLQDKSPDLVAELLDRVTHGGPLRRAVLESQGRAIAGIRATDFGEVLRERLEPVVARGPGTTGEERARGITHPRDSRPAVNPEGPEAHADRGTARRPGPS
jgi:glycosyltransferase involved in cell wall biosynthesis